jgi:Flp pilus assembly protein TadD
MNRDAPSIFIMTSVLAVSTLIGGCASGGGGSARSTSPYSTPSEDSRNTLKAQELTQQGVKLLDQNPERAEALFREALTHDIMHGPGHCNLGVMHLRAGRLFEAASEFEWARKLMPGHPDPRMNLALALERAGRIDEALCTYDTALEVYPNHMPTMQALCRLQLRHDRPDGRTKDMLQQIALGGQDASWRTWAQSQLIKLDARDRQPPAG